ncbi:GRAM domain-containing protein 4 [Saguinus oedipus]|uniref:GRAM domain-containing protein 4 n=1 Tax=Saguinus oedipus TaxID=9490 RepID=A0ABQ9WJJ3_SAGOE|nr:GRAM domain-containing protein 4 [Saguinus oedipus]
MEQVLVLCPGTRWHPGVSSQRRSQGLSSRLQKWFYERFGEYVEDFRFQPEENTVETEEPLSARRLTENMRRLKRGAKPVTNFVKNLSALSEWYSVYTSAIAFTVSGSSRGGARWAETCCQPSPCGQAPSRDGR